jgi:outer membrane protein TolC
LWQSNRATRNNILGLFFPGSTPLPISGPVLGTNSGTSVWGTAAGFLFSWEPFDFGARRAKVDLARAEESRFTAAATLAQLDTAVGAADAFLTLLASQQTVRAAKASVERSEVLLKAVDALVQSALRPGADAARAQAELATAQNQLIQAEQTEQVHQLTLAEWLGMAGTAVAVQSGPLVDVQPSEAVAEGFVKNHPLAVAQSANLDIVRARQRQLDRAYFPQFDFLASTYSRGTGALTNGQVLGGWNGLAPDTFNWAVGFTAKFRLFDFAVLREKKAVEEHHLNLESAKLDQVIQSLTTQTGKAKADWEASRRIAANTPVQLEAARIAERQVTARYRAGLATLVEVADAQRLLTQAETEDSVARLRVWRALLGLAAARGDLEPFLNEVRKVSTARP